MLKKDLEGIFEVDSIKEICEVPGLDVVRRLSCFEEICPSELDNAMAEESSFANVAQGPDMEGLSQHSLENGLMSEIVEETKQGSKFDEVIMKGSAAGITNISRKECEQKKSYDASQISPAVIMCTRNRKGKNRKFRKVHTEDLAF